MSFTIDHAGVRSGQRKYWNSVLSRLFAKDAKGNVAVSKSVEGIFDVVLQGGAIAVYELGALVPAGAIIRQAYYEVLTTFVTAGSDAGTIALKAGSTTLVTAVAVSDGSNPWDAGIKACIQVGTAATMSKISTDSNLTLTIAGQIASAGKLRLFVEYVI